MKEKVAILDCGGQYTKVIDRRVRELGIYTDIFPLGTSADKLGEYSAIILSGGPSSVWSDGAPSYDGALFDLGIPMLGICYGMQLINEHFGGKVLPQVKTEYGQTEIDIDVSCPLFSGLSPREKVLMSHGDAVKVLASGFECVGRTGDVVAAIYDEKRKIVGVQFHPEVDPTVNGVKMLENFLRGIWGLEDVYALEDRIETSVKMIRGRVGDGKVVVLVSGGVDSAVTAALLVRALKPEQVYAIHIDHGLMRKNESDIICKNLKNLGLSQMIRVNAENDFFNTALEIGGKKLPPLCQTADPETKRAIIGQMFFDVTERAARELDLDFDTAYLAQGTLRPDLIESGNPDVSGYAHKIKTHHNDVGVIRALRDRGHVIETNWDWHKDEVRKVARMLGLGEEIASRQPFPGPGLGVRIICSDGSAARQSEKQRDLIKNFAERESGGAFTAETAPVRSVGVQGDDRSYKTLTLLYSNGGADLDEAFRIAREIPNKFDFVNRVALCVSRTGERSVMCSPLYINHETADLLREIDAVVTKNVVGKKIAQCFAVLLPIARTAGKYSCAIRAVVTSDYMTASAAVPGVDFQADAIDKTVSEIRALLGDKIDDIYYDLTGKPPATVEWE